MRHVSRTHRFALDWLFDRINLDPKIQITYVDTTLSIWLEEHRETCSERTQSRRSVEFSSVAKGCRKGREYDETRSGRRGPGTYEFPWKSQAYEETRRIRKLRHRRCWHTMATQISIYLLPTFCILRKFSRIWDRYGLKPWDKMENLDVNAAIWRMFMSVTLQAALHLGERLFRQFSFHQESAQTIIETVIPCSWEVDHGFERNYRYPSDRLAAAHLAKDNLACWQGSSVCDCKNLCLFRFSVVYGGNQSRSRQSMKG